MEDTFPQELQHMLEVLTDSTAVALYDEENHTWECSWQSHAFTVTDAKLRRYWLADALEYVLRGYIEKASNNHPVEGFPTYGREELLRNVVAQLAVIHVASGLPVPKAPKDATLGNMVAALRQSLISALKNKEVA